MNGIKTRIVNVKTNNYFYLQDVDSKNIEQVIHYFLGLIFANPKRRNESLCDINFIDFKNYSTHVRALLNRIYFNVNKEDKAVVEHLIRTFIETAEASFKQATAQGGVRNNSIKMDYQDGRLSIRENLYDMEEGVEYLDDTHVSKWGKTNYSYLDFITDHETDCDEIDLTYIQGGQNAFTLFDINKVIPLIKHPDFIITPEENNGDENVKRYEVMDLFLVNSTNEEENFTNIDAWFGYALWNDGEEVLFYSDECIWGSTNHIIHVTNNAVKELKTLADTNEITLVV